MSDSDVLILRAPVNHFIGTDRAALKLKPRREGAVFRSRAYDKLVIIRTNPQPATSAGTGVPCQTHLCWLDELIPPSSRFLFSRASEGVRATDLINKPQ